MLVRLFKYLRGYVKIRVEGYSPERLLNLCNAHKILLWGVENQELIYEMYVSIKDYKRMRPLVRKTRTKIILLEKHGLPFFLHKFRKRKMFFLGVLLCVTAIYVLSLFIWNIHFEGNISQSNGELLAYLDEIGVSHGIRKSKIVCENIETKLRSQYPNMLWVSAEMRGTRIIIQIKENTDEDIISNIEVKNDEPVRIVTEKAGVVESMIVRQGTPIVAVGDEVEAGQTLVEGYYSIKNDAAEIIRYEGVPADADIYLISTEKYQDSFSVKYKEKIYTDKKRLGIKLRLFDKIYEFNPKIPFKMYDKTEDIKEIHITENFYLPISIELDWYLEYQEEEKIYSKEELIELVNFRYLNKYKNILQKGVQIIEKDVRIDNDGKLCIVGGYVTLRIPVTTKVPAIIPEIRVESSGEGEH